MMKILLEYWSRFNFKKWMKRPSKRVRKLWKLWNWKYYERVCPRKRRNKKTMKEFCN
jgi:hypothetical protein